jgi:PKD repeat protein
MVGSVVVAAPANNPPTVSASRTPSGDVTTGTAIAFSATGADPDNDTLTDDSYTNPGTYSAKVTVSDGRGGSADPTLTVVVTQANRNPSVTASRTPAGPVVSGTPIEFTATGSDPDGDPLTYSWDFGDSGVFTAQNPTHTYSAAGESTARVTVSDGRGGTGTTTVSVTVTGANQNPTVTADRTPTGTRGSVFPSRSPPPAPIRTGTRSRTSGISMPTAHSKPLRKIHSLRTIHRVRLC